MIPDVLERNDRWRELLGWSYSDFSDEKRRATDAFFLEDVKQFQASMGLAEDGVVGPMTYAARLRQRVIDLQVAANFNHRRNGFAATMGQFAVATATLLWLEDVVDPPDRSDRWEKSRAVIDKLIRTDIGLGWYWEPPYIKDGDYEWCGSLPAMAYAVFVPPAIRSLYFASTYRLDRFAQERSVHDEPPPVVTGDVKRLHVVFDEHSGPNDLDLANPRPGDIALVGGATDGYGVHVTLLESWDGRVLHTIEANSSGAGPHGNEREGVCRRTRPVGLKLGEPPKEKHLRRLIRLAPSDFVVTK
jgi:peptidoglycan hydrolase-like protein with peptidoglycan-binding domain